jgi:serine/threonine protein kinase
MKSDGTHPSPDRLAAFDTGRLQPDDREAVERHVVECLVCCRFLERLPEDALAARIREFACRSTSISPETHAPNDSPAPAELTEGLRDHPRYRVLDPLGMGGMGTVYRAVQINLDRVVALKVLHRQLTARPGFANRFRDEVKALARLNHPNVVAAYDADRAADLHFLVMEFVAGESLETVVARRGPLPVGEACDFARQAAVGLQHAYEHGLVHRDIKPANLLLTPAGVVKIADFGLGLVRLVGGEETAAPESVPIVLGTPEYMAPEQAREPNRADIRSDLYSLGCTLYFLLSGRPPFLGASRLQTLLDHQDAVPTAIAGLPPATAAVLDRLLAKEPNSRFATPAEAAEVLGRVISTREVATPPPTAPRRRRWPIAVGVGVVAAAIAVSVLAFGPHDHLTESPPLPNAPVEPIPPEPVSPALAIAPPPRLAARSPLASPEQLAAMRKQSMEQMVEWVRANNRWRPDADIAVQTATRVTTAPPKVDGFVLTFGGGLLKSEKPTLVSARTGSFFVFELTPEQAQGANLGPMSHVVTSHSHAADSRRTVPGVRLSDLRIDDADTHPEGARINGTLTCEFPTAPRVGDHLQITHYPPNGNRVMFLHHPKQTPACGRVVLRFSANPLEQRTRKDERLVIVFAEWVSDNGTSRVVESNTEAALLLVVGHP